MNIAILGYGVVGTGVYEIISNAVPGMKVKRVLDIKNISDSSVKKILTRDFDEILNISDIGIVVETMGGIEPAYSYVKEALKKGKAVVTSNKELVALHGAELIRIAEDSKVHFLFEASVGGGIPIIRTLRTSFANEKITEIRAVLNATTNYILTQMSEHGAAYEEALEKAKRGGFAEKNADNDVKGYDSARKLAILISLITGKHMDYTEISTEGITNITSNDINNAKSKKCRIKLIAHARLEYYDGLTVTAKVEPTNIQDSDMLYFVQNEDNAIAIKSDLLGETIFFGKGAGKFPTASAIVSDILEILKCKCQNIASFWSNDKLIL